MPEIKDPVVLAMLTQLDLAVGEQAERAPIYRRCIEAGYLHGLAGWYRDADYSSDAEWVYGIGATINESESAWGDDCGSLFEAYTTGHAAGLEEHDRLAQEAILADVVSAYLTTLLWSETGDDGEPLDTNHGPEDCDRETLDQCEADCTSFLELAWDELEGAGLSGDSVAIGHNFVLSRNGHGAGFWDLGLGGAGDRLHEIAKSFGTHGLMAWEGKVSSHG
jgi:hypothetical protein